MSGKIGVIDLDGIFLNSMPNIWSKQSYVQGFDCEYITFKKAVNMFEPMENKEYIYEGVVVHSYKQSTRSDSTRDGNSRKNVGGADL